MQAITKKAKVSPQDIYTNLDSSSFLSGLDSASLQDFANEPEISNTQFFHLSKEDV